MFDFSDGITTTLEAGLPPDVEPIFDMEECDLDCDYDAPDEDSGEINSIETQPTISTAAPLFPERTIKAYVVKYTAYRTFVGDS